MKVKDPRYDYLVTVSAHIIIENENNQILMTKRPETWEWAPGRWALIGGKLYQDESFEQAIKRKTKQELGFELKPQGLYQLKQLIIKEKQAYMYFFTSGYSGQEITGGMIDYKWFGLDDFKSADINLFSEYFYKNMLPGYLSGSKDMLPLSKINSLDYTKLDKTEKYEKWFEGVINKDYEPEKVDDFRKWRKSN